ncbi:hypothetical protein BDP27DRAFT_1419186 [Rhodocollybia butyracea]|uniref:Uncharacterized protein n=1 Tax=Rhodocollybia butyracea TaxID=206335 RepID=A0A9P5PZK8_9AGAR|nr:hypothetical protein BDP27DRAFT_1419186 [Rhodocollybia butyracea]
MPSITSLPIKITTKILRFYASSYLIDSFDITRIPANDSPALELQHIHERKELLAMLSVCCTFAAVLPLLLFHAVVNFCHTLCVPSPVMGSFAEALTYVEFSFSLASVDVDCSIATILHCTHNVRCIAFSFHPTCPLFVTRLLNFVQNYLPSHVSALILRMEITTLPLSVPDMFDHMIWGDCTWPAIFAAIPHVVDFMVVTMQYIVWPPFPCVENAMKNAWLANACPALQCLHLHYGHHALGNIALGTYLTQLQAHLVEPPDVLVHISCLFTCSEWRQGNTCFRRDRAAFPAATSSPQYARLFIFGKSLSFS